jgi:hypothetical protein
MHGQADPVQGMDGEAVMVDAVAQTSGGDRSPPSQV